MKVLILNWRDMKHPLAGGAEESLYRHAQYWIKKGATVEWFSSTFSKAKKQETIAHITYIRRGSHYTVHIYAFLYYLKKPADAYDVIIDSFHFLPYFSPLYKLKSKRIALINEAAKKAWFSNIRFPFNAIGYIAEPLFFKPYKNIPFITSASSILEELTDNYHIKKRNIVLIPHGVTIEKSHKKKEKNPTILYASRITHDKGIEDAVRSMSDVAKLNPEIQFWIVGKPEVPEYLEKIKQMVADFGIEKQTTFWGFVSQKKKFELMQRSWMLIHPSIREGWGLNVIEANSVGTPAIGYNVTGLRDSIQNNKTGLLTRQNTARELSVAVNKLIHDSKLRQALSKNAFLYAKQFDWNKAGDKSWSLVSKSSNK